MNQKTAIIGGGIAGLYLAYRFHKKNYNKWNVYEAQNQFGGKIQSHTYRSEKGQLHCEWGAIRFEWGLQPHLEKLITELDIALQQFPPFDKEESGDIKLIRQICEKLWKLYFDECTREVFRIDFADLSKEAHKGHMKELDKIPWVPFDGKLVYANKIGIMEWLWDYSKELHSNLLEAEKSIRAFIVNEFTVMGWLLRWTKVLLTNHQIMTCKEGNQSIVNNIVASLPTEKLHSNKELIGVETQVSRGVCVYRLMFSDGSVEECNTLLLCIPAVKILQLNIQIPNFVKTILKEIRGYQLARIFIEIQNPWWTEDEFFNLRHTSAEKLHSREVYYYSIPNTPERGVIMLYFEKKYIQEWKKIASTNDKIDYLKMRKEIASALSIDEERILSVRHKFWDGAHAVHGVNYLTPGYDAHTVMRKFTEINDGTLGIVGDAYSYDPGFIQGTLDSCNEALRNIYNFNP